MRAFAGESRLAQSAAAEDRSPDDGAEDEESVVEQFAEAKEPGDGVRPPVADAAELVDPPTAGPRPIEDHARAKMYARDHGNGGKRGHEPDDRDPPPPS